MVPCPPRNPPALTSVCALAIDPSTIKLPLFTVVVPVYVLAPVNVNVPVPDFVNWRTLVPFSSTPPKVVLVLSLPAVNVAVVAPLFKTVPFPESEPIVLLNPFKSKIEFTVKAEFGLKLVADPAWRVPALIVVPPV